MDNTLVKIESPQVTTSLTPTGWDLPVAMTEDDWKQAGSFLMQVNQARQWWLGDWWNACKWGDGEDACKEIGVDYQTSSDCGAIAKMFSITRRRVNLTFSHHKELRSIQDPAIQDQLLDWCLSGERRKSVRDLREKVQEYLEKKEWEDFDPEIFIKGTDQVSDELAQAKKEIETLKAKCTKLEKDGPAKDVEPNINNLIPGIKEVYALHGIMEARALKLSTMPEVAQQQWLSIYTDNISLENQLNEKTAKLAAMEDRPNPEPEVIEKVVEVMPEGTEEKIKDAERKDRQATKILKSFDQLKVEKEKFEDKAEQLNRERNELERKIKALEESTTAATPASIDDARYIKLSRLNKELDWIFPDVLKEAELAGGDMPKSKNEILDIISRWTGLIQEMDGRTVIDV